jgi:hypothetical protein
VNNLIELAAAAAVIGIGGSAAIDIWSAGLRRAFRVSTLDYAMLGRWIGHIPRGTFAHKRIGAAQAVPGERPLGWFAHYSIGVTFAALLLILAGRDWIESPTVWPAMAVGIATVAAPWFVMQPAFGAGIAGSKAANPWPGRLRNLGTHTVFGLGMWLTALALAPTM